jgi:hypothetical protein
MNMASAAPPLSVRLVRAQLITRVFTADLSFCAQYCRTGFVPFEYCYVKLKNSGDPMEIAREMKPIFRSTYLNANSD